MADKERKAFNFFKSYFDVFNALPTDEDKLSFVSALLDKQFYGIEPTGLKGMAAFAYISQKYNIDTQVKGYEDKTGIKLTPTAGGVTSPIEPPTAQEKEKGKEEVKEKGKEYSDEVKNFTRSVLKYFPIQPDKIERWFKEIDLLNRVDKYELNKIEEIIKVFRADSFWSGNFQSLLKLRKTNKEDIKYIDLFNQQLKIKGNGQSAQSRKPQNAADRGNGFETDWDKAIAANKAN